MQNISNVQINRTFRLTPWQTILLVLFFAICLTGCGDKGPKLMPVSGRVTFQGKPVSVGMVRFSNPSAGIDMLADLQQDGVYSVRMAKGNGLPEGTYAVAVTPPRVDAPVGSMTTPTLPKCPDIPAKYRDPSTSGLTLTLKSDNAEFSIDMQP